MTSADFIRKYHGVNDGRERTLSSIYKDSKGNIYSYGPHYPLLFTIDGLDFVNSRGYSSTTGKHIAWAHRATDYTAISVELNRGERLFWPDMTLDIIIERLTATRQEIQDELNKKVRKDTQVAQSLMDRIERINDSIMKVNARRTA